jgi:hypothetical protein
MTNITGKSHILKSQDKHHQQVRNTSRHHSHSPTREPKIGVVSRLLGRQQGTAVTHFLERQEQGLSAG